MADVPTIEHRERLPLGFSTRVPLGFQVLAGVGGLVVLVALAVVLAVVLVRGLGDGATELTEREVEHARALDAAALRFKAMANDERGFLLSGSSEFVERFDRRADRVRASLATAERTADTGGQREAIGEVRTGFDLWVREVRAEVAAFRDGDQEGAVTTALGPTRDVRLTVEASLDEAQQLGDSAIESGADSVSTTSSQSVVILLVYLGIALVVGGAIALWLMRTILKPVYALLAIFAEPGSTERLVERYTRAQQ